MPIEFYEVTEETVDDVVKIVGEFKEHKGDALRDYFLQQLQLPDNKDHTLVVFKAREIWQHIFIGNEFNIPYVMEQMEIRLAD